MTLKGLVVKGYLAYHEVPTNSRAISAFRYHVAVIWYRTLRRRCQRADYWGHGCRRSPTTGSRNLAPFIHGRVRALPSTTQGRSRVRETCMLGSVRGAPSNGRPYRDYRAIAGLSRADGKFLRSQEIGRTGASRSVAPRRAREWKGSG